MTSVHTHLAEIRAEAERLTALLETYPDLTVETNRVRHSAQCSKAVNAIATDYEIHPFCECCPDPALYVRVYVETTYGKVYGMPYQIEIGERDDGIDLPIEDWESVLCDHGIRDSIITRLRAHFDNQLTDEETLDETVHRHAS